MQRWHLDLLGGLRARQADVVADRFPTRPTGLLLARLALPVGRVWPREMIAGQLWPDASPRDGRHSLRQALYFLRQRLPGLALETEGGLLRLDPAGVVTDVGRFEGGLAAAAKAQDDARCAEFLAAALACAEGELLPGAYEDWVEAERQRLEARRLRALHEIVETLVRLGEPLQAIDYARRLVALDPLDEAAHLTLMRLYADAGQTARACRQYDVLTRQLHGALGTEPSAEARTLRQRLGADPPASAREGTVRLPHFLSSLVGREAEAAALEALLIEGTARLVTLTGAAGVGKTRLAVSAARRLARAFPDGVALADLAPLTVDAAEDAVTGAVAGALGLPPAAGNASLSAVLAPRRMLLVLDNLEHLLPACRRIVRQLLAEAKDLVILATSRSALEIPGETVWPLAPLRSDEAVRLFRERARSVGARLMDEEAASVAAICQRLDGLPLALELAAARAAHLGAAEIARRLDRPLRLLQGAAGGEARFAGLQASLDFSVDLLDAGQRWRFALLSVFAGGFTIEDVEALCADPAVQRSVAEAVGAERMAADTFETILQLHRHSLVTLAIASGGGATRFRLLEVLRACADERLRTLPGVSEAAQVAHAHWALQRAEGRLAQLRTRGEAQAMRALAGDESELRAALPRVEGTLRARLALALGRFLIARGMHREAAAPIAAGLEAGAEGGLRAALLRERAEAHRALNEAEDARRCAEEAEALAAGEGDGASEADAWNLRAQAAALERDFVGARRLLLRALERYESRRQTLVAARVRNSLGWLEFLDPDGDREKSRRYLQAALEVLETAGDLRGTARAVNNLGCLAQEAQRWTEADRAYRRALACELEVDHPYGVAIALNNLAEIAEETGQARAAARRYLASRRLFFELGHHLERSVAGRLAALDLPPDALAPPDDDIRETAALANWALGENFFASRPFDGF